MEVAETIQTETVEPKAQQTNVIQKFEFANGLRVLVKEDHRLPFAHEISRQKKL